MPKLRVVSLVAASLAIALPAGTRADEVWVPPAGGAVIEEIAAEDGRMVYVGSLEPGPLALIEGFGSEGRLLPASKADVNSAISYLDLGTDRRGRAVAVYTYHRRHTPSRLYRYDFVSGRARVMLVSRRDCLLFGPHMEGGVLYFAREGRRSRPGCRPGIYQKRPGEPLRRLTTRAYEDFDVSGGVVAFIRSRVVRREDMSEGTSSRFAFEHVFLLRVGERRARLVASAGYRLTPHLVERGGVVFDRVSLDGDHVYWLRFNYDTGEEDLLRARVRGRDPGITKLSGERRELPRPGAGAFPTQGYAVDGDRIYYHTFAYEPSTGSFGPRALARVSPLPPIFE
jgi:hypothetical protein